MSSSRCWVGIASTPVRFMSGIRRLLLNDMVEYVEVEPPIGTKTLDRRRANLTI
jgi:hypothetical protein